MRVIVTGSAGFVGRAICRRFQGEHEVIGTVREPASLAWHTLVHDWTRPYPAAPSLEADLLIHAAFAGTASSSLAVNETMARNVAEAAARFAVGRVCLVSSGSVYREQDSAVHEGSALVDESGAPYPRSCARVEGELRAGLGDSIPLQIVRLFHPYGPGQSCERLIRRVAASLVARKPIELRPGSLRSNPVFIDDVAEAIFRLAGLARPLTVNVGGAEVVTIRELCERIARALGASCQFVPAGLPAGRDLFCEIAELERLTGLRPATRLDEGLQAALKDLTL